MQGNYWQRLHLPRRNPSSDCASPWICNNSTFPVTLCPFVFKGGWVGSRQFAFLYNPCSGDSAALTFQHFVRGRGFQLPCRRVRALPPGSPSTSTERGPAACSGLSGIEFPFSPPWARHVAVTRICSVWTPPSPWFMAGWWEVGGLSAQQ